MMQSKHELKIHEFFVDPYSILWQIWYKTKVEAPGLELFDKI